MSAPSPPRTIAVVIPARDEHERVGSTVEAALRIPLVDLVVVVDDGSRDDTGGRATAAGAVVVRHSRPRGKGAAMESGAVAVAAIEARERAVAGGSDQESSPARALLFLDADLGETAAEGAPLATPVMDGLADMTVAVLPAQTTAAGAAAGGRGLVVRLSRAGIARATGWAPTQPLSGQRCLTRAAFEAARPLARGFGVETGLSIDLMRQGYRVLEVEIPFRHRATGGDVRSQIHRAKQWWHVARALASRQRLRRQGPPIRMTRAD